MAERGIPQAGDRAATDNADQRTFWSHTAAPIWLDHQAMLDAAFQPVLDAVLDAAAIAPGHAVLDVGCGTGASCLQAAERAGPGGRVLGLDISAPLLDRARARGQGRANIDFRLDDAQTAALPQAAFDRLISRFGVMFFADTAAAFRNLALGLKPGACLALAAWGEVAANPFFTLPHKVAAQRLGSPPKADRNAPGPFAFHDITRVEGLLAQAGLTGLQSRLLDLRLGPDQDLPDLVRTICSTGPVRGIMDMFGGTQADAAAIEAEVLAGFRALAADAPGIPARINLFLAETPA